MLDPKSADTRLLRRLKRARKKHDSDARHPRARIRLTATRRQNRWHLSPSSPCRLSDRKISTGCLLTTEGQPEKVGTLCALVKWYERRSTDRNDVIKALVRLGIEDRRFDDAIDLRKCRCLRRHHRLECSSLQRMARGSAERSGRHSQTKTKSRCFISILPPSTWHGQKQGTVAQKPRREEALWRCERLRGARLARRLPLWRTGAVNRLTVRRPWPGVRVSSWTISPGVVGLRPLGGRLAWGRRRRSARGDLRRSAGTGETAPFSTSLLRMRRSRRRPYRRSRTAILALPHVGWPAHASRAAFTSAGGQAGRRWGRRDARRPRRLRQRETLPALAAACAVKPPARACRQRSRASRPCARAAQHDRAGRRRGSPPNCAHQQLRIPLTPLQ